MKRAFFLLWIAILIAGCGEGPLGKGALNGLDNGPGDETGGLFGDQPGSSGEGIPIEGETTPEEKKPTAPAEKVAVIKPVEITKAGGNLGTCVIGEACEKRISAKGGSGEYVWTLIEGVLPKGLELVDTETQKVKINKKIEGQEIDEVGEFAFKLKVEDEADAERSAERKCTLRVNEDLAMDFYTMAVDENSVKQWVHVEEKDENGADVPITVPPKGRFLAVVIGRADNYQWSIDGLEITCSAESCVGENENIKLYKDTTLEPPNLPPHHQSIIVEAKEDFIGQTAQNVVISAAQDYGDPVSKVISSITFQQDPCKIELAVTGGMVTANPGQYYKTSFAVSGGLKDYSWREGSGEWTKVEGNAFDVSGMVTGGATLKELKEGVSEERRIEIKDSCPTPQQTEATLTVSVPFDDRLIDDVSDIRIQTDFTDVNDTSSDGTTWLEIRFWSKGTQLGKVHYDLDPCGDNGGEGNCEGVRAIEGAVKGTKITEIDDIEVHFYDEDCFLCGYLDCDIITVTITTDHWKALYEDDAKNNDKFNDDVCNGDEHCGGSVTDKMTGYEAGTNGIWNIWQYIGD